MTTGFVADATVGVAWVLPSQSSGATEQLLDDVETGTPFVVPVLWMFEVSNSLLVMTRRSRIAPEQYDRARLTLGRLNPTVDEDGPRLAFGNISDLAAKYGLSVYDAAYLELAVRRRLPLASRDADLNKAAKVAGVRTLV